MKKSTQKTYQDAPTRPGKTNKSHKALAASTQKSKPNTLYTYAKSKNRTMPKPKEAATGISSVRSTESKGKASPHDMSQPTIMATLEDLRQAIASDGGEHRQNYRRNLSNAYELAIHLKADRDCRLQLEAHQDWEYFANTRISKKDPAFLLVTVLTYLFRAKTRPKKQKVSKVKKALEPFFIHDISPKDVRALLIKGGIPALSKKAPEMPRSDTKTKTHINKSRMDIAKNKFDFDPGDLANYVNNTSGTSKVGSTLEFKRQPSGRVKVKVLSLNATI